MMKALVGTVKKSLAWIKGRLYLKRNFVNASIEFHLSRRGAFAQFDYPQSGWRGESRLGAFFEYRDILSRRKVIIQSKGEESWPQKIVF
jgi:hypothetical protein